MTNLLQTLRNGITTKKTNQITSRRLDEDDTTNDDDLMTYQEQNAKQRDDITKHATISQNTNKNVDKTNDNSDTIKIDDDLIKSLNPEGEVVVDNLNTNRQNDITKHETVNANTNEDLENTNDIMKLDDDFIKSVNPEGQVVVDNSPRKALPPKQLFYELNSKHKNAKTDQNTNEIPQNTNEIPQNTIKIPQQTNDPLQNTNDNLQNTNENRQNTNKFPHTTNEFPPNTNENRQNTNKIGQNDNSDRTKLDQDLVKLINPQGEVVVDDSRQPPTFNEQLTKDNSAVDRDDIQNDLMTNLRTDETRHDEEAFIKSINPAGGVVVDTVREGKRKQSQTEKLQSKETFTS